MSNCKVVPENERIKGDNHFPFCERSDDMQKRTRQPLKGESRKRNPKKVKSERPEKLDKEHGEEVKAPRAEGSARARD
jgi:hypothetical protein